MDKPPQLTFETIAKQFMTLCTDRYPTKDKVLATTIRLGVVGTLPKIIVISQMRDAVRQVALNQVFRTIDHRNEVEKAIIEALEELEDSLEEEDKEK